MILKKLYELAVYSSERNKGKKSEIVHHKDTKNTKKKPIKANQNKLTRKARSPSAAR